MFDEKAQIHTLEGVLAATIMLLVIAYAIDATSMTPLTSSTANVHVETELQTLGQDILSSTDYSEPGYDSSLKNDIMNWNGDVYVWNGTNYSDMRNSSNPPLENNLAKILKATLVSQGIAHNVEITFIDNYTLMPSDSPNSCLSQGGSIYMICNGNPSDNAVIISRKLVLHDGNLTSPLNQTITDIDPSTNLYNIVEVKLILWRM